MTSKRPGAAWIHAARALSGRAQPRAASLLDGVAASESPPDPELEAAQRQLDRVLTEFRESDDRGAEAFGRYCDTLARIIARAGLPERRAAQLLGLYVQAAAGTRRAAGRPRDARDWLYAHAWHEINLERAKNGQPLFVGRVPAGEIARRCATRYGVEVSAAQVSDAFRSPSRTAPCPYYGKNAPE